MTKVEARELVRHVPCWVRLPHTNSVKWAEGLQLMGMPIGIDLPHQWRAVAMLTTSGGALWLLEPEAEVEVMTSEEARTAALGEKAARRAEKVARLVEHYGGTVTGRSEAREGSIDEIPPGVEPSTVARMVQSRRAAESYREPAGFEELQEAVPRLEVERANGPDGEYFHVVQRIRVMDEYTQESLVHISRHDILTLPPDQLQALIKFRSRGHEHAGRALSDFIRQHVPGRRV